MRPGRLDSRTAPPPPVAVAFLVILSVAGCGPSEGKSCGIAYLYSPSPLCKGNDLWVCSGNGLRSGAGAWTRTACKGAAGCRRTKSVNQIACDISGNAAGDPCVYNFTWNNTLEACSVREPKVLLHCGGDHVIRREPCPGGCTQTSEHQARCASTESPPVTL